MRFFAIRGVAAFEWARGDVKSPPAVLPFPCKIKPKRLAACATASR